MIVPKNLRGEYGVFYEDNINPKVLITLILFIIFGIVTLFTIADGIEHLFVPQWYAVKDIVDF